MVEIQLDARSDWRRGSESNVRCRSGVSEIQTRGARCSPPWSEVEVERYWWQGEAARHQQTREPLSANDVYPRCSLAGVTDEPRTLAAGWLDERFRGQGTSQRSDRSHGAQTGAHYLGSA